MTEKRNRIMVKGMLILLLFVTIFTCIFNVSYAINDKNAFDSTNVFDDLNSCTMGSNRFDFSEYPFDDTRDIQCINVVEYCYSAYANKVDNYGLYLYIYNPKNLDINTASRANVAQIATKYNDKGVPIEYNKYELQFCNKAEDLNYKNLYYKFKVKDKNTILNRLKGATTRQYDISGIEILTKGANLAVDYKVGGSYSFSGYAKGYGTDALADSTLSCAIKNLETVELNVGSTCFRTNSSSLGKDHQNQLNTAFFNVPNRFFDNYGGLQKIHADWYEYKTTPMIVTKSQDIYNEFMKHYDGYGQNIAVQPLAFAYNYSHIFNQSSSIEKMDWDFNVTHNNTNSVGFINSSTSKSESYSLPYFYKSNWEKDTVKINDIAIKKNEVLNTINNYKLNHKGYIPNCYRNISRDLFDNKVDDGRIEGYNNQNIDGSIPFDMLSYADTHGFWDTLFAYGFGKKPTDETILNVSPIQIVTANDFLMADKDFAKKFMVAEDSVADMRKNQTLANKTVLFRFAQTDYFSAFVNTFWNNQTNKHEAFMSTQTVFLDFDIIDLTFGRDGVFTVIPAVSNPIDIANDITTPNSPDLNWKDILKKIVMIIAIILLVIMLAPLIPIILKIVIWIIALPFKLIGSIVNACKKRDKGAPKAPKDSGSAEREVKHGSIKTNAKTKQKAKERFKE